MWLNYIEEEEKNLFQQILMKKKRHLKHKISIFYLNFTKALLVTFSIYCYLIKFLVKQKHILPLHVKNNKLKEFYIDNTNYK